MMKNRLSTMALTLSLGLLPFGTNQFGLRAEGARARAVAGYIYTASESKTKSGDTKPGKETAQPAGNAMQMAENDPEAFLVMMRQRVLDDLVKERDRKSLASIPKYEAFVAKIQNEKSRIAAQEMLKELRENYTKTWHLLYPITLSPRWREIKGNPAARKDFAEILGMAGVKACGINDIAKVLEPVEGLKLFGSVNYLDPLEEAVRKLSDPAGGGYKLKSNQTVSFNRVESAGFPLDTFDICSYDVEGAAGSVNRVYFLVDNYRRVIAFQEQVESPKSVELYNHTNLRSVYNFPQMRRKGVSSYEIAYMDNRTSGASSRDRGNGVCILTSELIDTERKPREWVRLHLPHHLARFCMFICQGVGN